MLISSQTSPLSEGCRDPEIAEAQAAALAAGGRGPDLEAAALVCATALPLRDGSTEEACRLLAIREAQILGQIEQSDWPEHASFMDGLVDAGFVVLGGPLADEQRVGLAIEAKSEATVRATLARDPWSETHLRIDTIEPWAVRLDGRRA